jgi:hypothetical protein
LISSRASRTGRPVQDNPFVLRPAVGVAPAHLKAAAVQARAAAAFLAEEYSDGISLVLGVRALLDEIQWDEERTDDAEAAWARLGRHLGFTSSRPERLYGTGPDNLWALSTDRHAVIELKTGCTTATIARKDVDQLGGSVRWDQEQHPDVASVPIMLHPSRDCDERGTPVPAMRVVTPAKLETLKLAVVAYAVALADGQGRWGDELAVAKQLAHHKLTPATCSRPTPRSRSGNRRSHVDHTSVHDGHKNDSDPARNARSKPRSKYAARDSNPEPAD